MSFKILKILELARLMFKCFNIIFSLKDWIGNVILKHSCMDVTWMVLAKDGLVVFTHHLGGTPFRNVSDILGVQVG